VIAIDTGVKVIMEERPGTVYNAAAKRYHEARPDYPPESFDELVALTSLPAQGRIVEIGCGTGQATLPLAQRGYRITGIEPGPQTAALARENLADYPEAMIWPGTFEDWPVQMGAFDLALAANAFHWLDCTRAYPKIAEALVPGGRLALLWNQQIRATDDRGFSEATRSIYAREVPALPGGPPGLLRADEIADIWTDDIATSGFFGRVTVRHHYQECAYDAAAYTALLGTYGAHLALDEARRVSLLDSVAALIDTRFGGRVLIGWLATLYVARRR